MKKILLGAALALSLAGCATTSGLDAQTTVSEFDGTKSVTIAPHNFDCLEYVVCANFGFNWRNKDPDNAAVMVEIMDMATKDYHAISGLRLNIDGEFIDVKPYPTSTTKLNHDILGTMVTTYSRRVFIAPISLLEKIEQSQNTKAQVLADGAVIEGELKNSGESTKAYYAMLRFLEQVRVNND